VEIIGRFLAALVECVAQEVATNNDSDKKISLVFNV